VCSSLKGGKGNGSPQSTRTAKGDGESLSNIDSLKSRCSSLKSGSISLKGGGANQCPQSTRTDEGKDEKPQDRTETNREIGEE